MPIIALAAPATYRRLIFILLGAGWKTCASRSFARWASKCNSGYGKLMFGDLAANQVAGRYKVLSFERGQRQAMSWR